MNGFGPPNGEPTLHEIEQDERGWLRADNKKLRAKITRLELRVKYDKMMHRKEHEALDVAGVDSERVIDCVPAQQVWCRIEWLAGERDALKVQVEDLKTQIERLETEIDALKEENKKLGRPPRVYTRPVAPLEIPE